jgi:Flp pilus assembly protein TadB
MRLIVGRASCANLLQTKSYKKNFGVKSPSSRMIVLCVVVDVAVVVVVVVVVVMITVVVIVVVAVNSVPWPRSVGVGM